MILAIYGILILFIYILELITHKRLRFFLPFITVIYFIIMMGGNISNPDTTIYYNIYNNKEFFYKDFGFGILVYICNHKFGLDINAFRLLLAIIGIGMMSRIVNKYVKKQIVYYLLYFLYPFMMDVVQVRNFLIMCILMNAVDFLLDKSKISIVKYIILILIAATIQKTALVYLPLVIIHRIESKKIIRLLIIASAVFSIFIGFNSGIVNTLGNFLLNSVSDSLSGSSKFLTRNTNFGWIILWGEQICNCILIFWSKRILEKSEKICRDNPYLLKQSYDKNKKFFNLVFWINIYLFCFCPLYVLNINFYRIMRNVMTINLMIYSITWNLRRNWSSSNRIIYGCSIWGYAIFVFYVNFFYNGSGEYIDSILKPMFTMNWLFQ